MPGGWHRGRSATLKQVWLTRTHSHRVRVDRRVLEHYTSALEVPVTLKRVNDEDEVAEDDAVDERGCL
jgi:hypothetical protein